MHADSLNLNAMCAEFTISEQAEKLKTSKSLEQDNFKMTSNVKLPKYDYNPEL